MIENANPRIKVIDTLSTNGRNRDLLQRPEKTADQDTDDAPREADEESKSIRDPLHWFGVLIPPALRASQSHFKNATMENIPALVSLEKELSEVEIEVRRTRKRLKKVGLSGPVP